MTAVILDAGPLAIVTQKPGHSKEVDDCQSWFSELEKVGVAIYVPEVADYEVRRELIRLGKTSSLKRLDALNLRAIYLPITTPAMRRAADLWAEVRALGLPTAGPHSLDADVILAGQALSLGLSDLKVATSNARHLSRFLDAADWRSITP
jgi:predicted nucleic acid-binding protein